MLGPYSAEVLAGFARQERNCAENVDVTVGGGRQLDSSGSDAFHF